MPWFRKVRFEFCVGLERLTLGHRLVATTLLLAHASLLIASLQQNFVVVDEVGHIPAGIYHWKTGRFNVYEVNPPLPRMLAVLPLLSKQSMAAFREKPEVPGIRWEWHLGRDFAEANASRYFSYICWARIAGIAWSLLGAYTIYRWSSELYGSVAGCLALGIWCLDPNVVAFAQLVVPDVPAAVAGLAATYGYWRYLRKPSWREAGCAGLLLGLAQLTKFTLLILYVAWPLIGLLWRIRPREDNRLPSRIGHGILIVLLSVAVINVGYGCDGSCRRLGDIPFVSRMLAGEATDRVPYAYGQSGNHFQGTWMGQIIVPLPCPYVQGIDMQRLALEIGSPSYLAGRWDYPGWWYYYLYALSVKTPLGVLLLALCGLALSLARHPSSGPWWDELCIWVPAACILAFVSSQTGINNHMRYILPIFPFVAIGTSKVAHFFQCHSWKPAIATGVLLAWACVSTLLVYPHFLSYFNILGGGPRNGHMHLLNSNMDWGQDLLFLKSWLAKHPEASPLGLVYYNLVDPGLIGIKYFLPPKGPDPHHVGNQAREEAPGPRPGYYALSVNFLHGTPFVAPDGRGGMEAIEFHAYEYFQEFEPIARAGYSILIYHITLEKANAVRSKLGMMPLGEGNSRTAKGDGRTSRVPRGTHPEPIAWESECAPRYTPLLPCPRRVTVRASLQESVLPMTPECVLHQIE